MKSRRRVNSTVMPLSMYFDVYIDGTNFGSFGHENVDNLSVSVSGAADGVFVFPGAVCREGNNQVHYSWEQTQVAPNAEIRIVSGTNGPASHPTRRFEMGCTKRKAWEGNVCEFCQRNETQVTRLIPGDDNRPGICSDCVELCNAYSRTRHNKSLDASGGSVFRIIIGAAMLE